eukprot:6058638-Prymnesium_polylepis.1
MALPRSRSQRRPREPPPFGFLVPRFVPRCSSGEGSGSGWGQVVLRRQGGDRSSVACAVSMSRARLKILKETKRCAVDWHRNRGTPSSRTSPDARDAVPPPPSPPVFGSNEVRQLLHAV